MMELTSSCVAEVQSGGVFRITDVQGSSHVQNQVSTPGTEKAFPLGIYVKKSGDHPASYTINRGTFTEA